MAESPHTPPLTDSFGFWVCLFATVALMGLVAYGPKYRDRQLQVERQGQGHQRAREIAQWGQAKTEVSTRDNLSVSLNPLIWMMGVILVISWGVLWWQHFRTRSVDSAGNS